MDKHLVFYGTAVTVYFSVRDAADPLRFLTGHAFQAGDVVKSLDGAAEDNANTPSVAGPRYALAIDAADLEGAILDLMVADQTEPPAFADRHIQIETYGHPSARHATEIRLKKNAAYASFHFQMRSSLDHVTPLPGLTVTAQRAIDNGGFGPCANAPVDAGEGLYRINLAASDLDGDSVTLYFTAPGADPLMISVITQP